MNHPPTGKEGRRLYRLLSTSKHCCDELEKHDISYARASRAALKTFMVRRQGLFVAATKQLDLSFIARRSPSSTIRSFYGVPSLRQWWISRTPQPQNTSNPCRDICDTPSTADISKLAADDCVTRSLFDSDLRLKGGK